MNGIYRHQSKVFSHITVEAPLADGRHPVVYHRTNGTSETSVIPPEVLQSFIDTGIYRRQEPALEMEDGL